LAHKINISSLQRIVSNEYLLAIPLQQNSPIATVDRTRHARESTAEEIAASHLLISPNIDDTLVGHLHRPIALIDILHKHWGFPNSLRF
jgi:hypothetical protein